MMGYVKYLHNLLCFSKNISYICAMENLNLTKNLLVVTYVETNSICFAINLEYGNVTTDLIKHYCDKFFSRLFPEYNIDSKIVGIVGSFTNIEIDTPIGLKVLTWSWESLYC